MACHEIAALRLGMMNLLGKKDEAEREHELAELGPLAHEAGPIQTLSKSADLLELKETFTNSLSDLEDRVAQMAANDPKLAYHRTLLVMTRKTELDLKQLYQQTEQLYRDLEDMHDYIHEVYPVES